jgi:hypothetical protein
MVGIEDAKLTQMVQRRMSEFEFSLAQTHGFDNGAMRDATQRHYDSISRQSLEFVREILVARIDFCTDRLVAGRQAFHGIGDAAIDEFEAIVSRFRMVARAEAVLVQHLVQQDTRVIARERSTRAIGTVHARGKSNDQETRVCSAERRNRATIVSRIAAIDLVKKLSESWACTTRLIEYCHPVFRGQSPLL